MAPVVLALRPYAISRKGVSIKRPFGDAPLFDPEGAVDLYYDVVLKATEWPTRDFSIKTLATHLGFKWRDSHPSGAASIEWFHRWVESDRPASPTLGGWA